MKILILVLTLTFISACSASSASEKPLAASPTVTAPTTEKSKVIYSGGGVKELKDLQGARLREIELWANKDMDQRLGKLLGSDYQEFKETWVIEGPIVAEGDILMTAGCDWNNNCSTNQWVMFVDVAKDNINIQHFKNGKPSTYKEKDEIVLPEKFVQDLAAVRSSSGVK